MKKYLLSAFFAVALLLPWASKAQTNCDKIQDYTVTSSATVGALASPIAGSTGYADSVLNYRDNNGIAQIAMPFSMVLGSQMINAGDPLYISRNGFISFKAPTAYNAMPTTKVIAPLACTGSDVYNDGALNIYKAYNAAAKTLTIEWSNASLNGSTFNFQVILSHDDNGVEFKYGDPTPVTTSPITFAKRVVVSGSEYYNVIANTAAAADFTNTNTSYLTLAAGVTPDECKFALVHRKPCTVWATDVTETTATLRWTNVGNDNYDLFYALASDSAAFVSNVLANASNGTITSSPATKISTANDTVPVTGLTSNTRYLFAVVGQNAVNRGKFSGFGSFTTKMESVILELDSVCMYKSLATGVVLNDSIGGGTHTIDTIWDANGNKVTELTATDRTSYYTVLESAPAAGKFYKVRMNTIVKTPTTQDQTVNVCDVYYWDNTTFAPVAAASATAAQTYTASTIKIDTIKTIAPFVCEIHSLHLTIRESTVATIKDTACGEYNWHVVGTYHYLPTGATAERDTLYDTIFPYTIAPVTAAPFTATTSDVTSSPTLNGATTGLTIYNAAGCDSTITLNLHLKSAFVTNDTAAFIASSEGQLVWNGKRYLAPAIAGATGGNCTIYHETVFIDAAAQNGCDSMNYVQLMVGHPYYTADNVLACGEHTWHGTTYAQLDENAPAGASYRNMTDGGYVYNTALPSYTWHDTTNVMLVGATHKYKPDTVWSLHLTFQEAVYTEVTMNHNMTTATLNLGGAAIGVLPATPVVLTMADYRTNHADVTVDTSVSYGATTMYCDSIVRYHLNLVYNYTEVPMTICMGAMGAVDPTLAWTAGDTTITYSIPTTLNPRNDTTYIPWTALPADGGYYIKNAATANAQGYILVLSAKKNTYSYDTVTACGSYEWHGTNYTVAPASDPTYTIEGGAFNGCDSVMLLHLTLNAAGSTVAETVTETACNSYEWQGATYTRDTTVVGNPYVNSETHCNVIPTLVLHIATGGNSTIVDSACDSYTWHDSTYTVSTTAIHTIAGAASGECDSVVTLNLTIFLSEIDTIADVVCNGYDYNRNGFSIAASAYANRNDFTAVRIERGATVHHCNIVHMLNLTVGNTQVFDTTIVACDNYIWHGTTFTNDVYLVDTVANAQGCDSITNLTVQIVASTSDTTAATACDSYTWSRNATTYTAAGTYTATETAGPCTTTHVLVLNLGTNSNVTIDTTACAAFVWDGTTYTTSQTITLPGTNAQGCDSNYIINLTVQNATNVSVVEQACGVFVWSVNGQTYTTTSTDTYEFGNCDSVYVLNVTIYPVYTQNFNVTACESYEWNDSVYTANTTATATFPTVDNCDSVVTINLSLGQSYTTDTAVAGCNSVVYDGVTYYESTERYDRYTTDYGCDSIISLVITVNHSGYSYEEDTAYNAFYTWHGQTCTSTGAYIDTLPAHGEFCDSIYILNLYVMDTTEGIVLSEMGEISLYPNPTTGVLNISADNVVRVDVLDLVGRTVARFENTNRFDISRLPAGAYTLRIATTDRVMVSKVVKR